MIHYDYARIDDYKNNMQKQLNRLFVLDNNSNYASSLWVVNRPLRCVVVRKKGRRRTLHRRSCNDHIFRGHVSQCWLLAAQDV